MLEYFEAQCRIERGVVEGQVGGILDRLGLEIVSPGKGNRRSRDVNPDVIDRMLRNTGAIDVPSPQPTSSTDELGGMLLRISARR